MTILKDEGQVKLLTLPPNWTEEPEPAGADEEEMVMHGPQTKSFVLKTNLEVKLNFFYRGFPVPPKTAAAFHSVIAAGTHDLNADELESIAMIVREASEPEYFDLSTLRVDVLRNRQVLVVEGFNKEEQKYDLGIYIDADGTGSIVQEIHYIAPAQVYGNHRAEVMSIFNTLEWR